MNIAEILKNIDIEKVAEEFAQEMRQKTQARIAFWNSPLCERMIADMIAAKNGFDEETFSYFPEKVKEQYGWQCISNDDIAQFINVMVDSSLGMPEDFEPEEDEDCYFDNMEFVKKGIHVFVMHGQGRAVSLTPQ